LKYLLILLVLSVLFILLYRRLRPYLLAAQRMLGIVREVRRMGMDQAEQPAPRSAKTSADRLVRCASCDTWIPSSRSLKSHTAAQYCSSACLERSSTAARQKRVGGR
jgi:hypothetical protein